MKINLYLGFQRPIIQGNKKCIYINADMEPTFPRANKIYTATSTVPIQPIYEDIFICLLYTSPSPRD